jgi:hypothetical protein
MKKTTLLLLWFLAALAADAQDTVTLTVCNYYWKDLRPVKGANIELRFIDPNFPQPTLEFKADSASNCLTIKVPVSMLSADAKIRVLPKKTDNPLNGMTSLDMFTMRRMILGVLPLPGQYSLLAADVNSSLTLSTLDIVWIRNALLGYEDNINKTNTWEFINQKIKLPDTLLAYPSQDIKLADFKALNGDTLKFLGIKNGDVDDDLELSYQKYQGPPAQDSLPLVLQDTLLPAGKYNFWMPVFIKNGNINLDALQFELRSVNPAVSLTNFRYVKDSAQVIGRILPNGRFRYLGYSSIPQQIQVDQNIPVCYVRLSINSTSTVPLRQSITFKNADLVAFMAQARPDKSVKVYRAVEKFEVLSTQAPANFRLKSLPVWPNPFKDKAFVQVEIPESGAVLLEVFELSGRLVWSQEQMLSAGDQQLEIPAEAVPAGRMALYRIRAGGGVAVGKLTRE